jgi:transcriptional regulator with XRE-family HTH domain
MNNLKSLRLCRGLSQRQIAVALGIHEATYCRIERGWLTRPPAELDARLQKVFGPEWTWERLMADAVPPVPDGAA